MAKDRSWRCTHTVSLDVSNGLAACVICASTSACPRGTDVLYIGETEHVTNHVSPEECLSGNPGRRTFRSVTIHCLWHPKEMATAGKSAMSRSFYGGEAAQQQYLLSADIVKRFASAFGPPPPAVLSWCHGVRAICYISSRLVVWWWLHPCSPVQGYTCRALLLGVSLTSGAALLSSTPDAHQMVGSRPRLPSPLGLGPGPRALGPETARRRSACRGATAWPPKAAGAAVALHAAVMAHVAKVGADPPRGSRLCGRGRGPRRSTDV